MAKRYYWLKLKQDFFKQLPIKKLRKIAGGDTYTIIYLKMMLQSLSRDGNANYYSFDDDFISNLALEIDEDVENVKITVSFLIANGLLVESNDGNQKLTAVPEMIGSESASTVRSRECRARQKAQKVLQCNTNATQLQQNCSVDIDIEIEKEINKEKEENADAYNPILQWEKVVGLTLTSHIAEKIVDLYEEVGELAFDKAIKTSVEMNKRNFRYIEATARNIANGNDFSEKTKKPKEELNPIKSKELTKEQKEVLQMFRELYA